MFKNTYLILSLLLICSGLIAQQHIISGEIVDETGVQLPGVTVIEFGTTNGVISDLNGMYVLNLSDKNASIVFSYLGFETVTIPVNNQRYINIILKEDFEELDDVQVVAFQKQKRNSVIGSISTINPAELQQPTSNFTAGLAGKLAGVISYQRSGEPGQDNAQFFIRGVTTFGYTINRSIRLYQHDTFLTIL